MAKRRLCDQRRWTTGGQADRQSAAVSLALSAPVLCPCPYCHHQVCLPSALHLSLSSPLCLPLPSVSASIPYFSSVTTSRFASTSASTHPLPSLTPSPLVAFVAKKKISPVLPRSYASSDHVKVHCCAALSCFLPVRIVACHKSNSLPSRGK